MGLGRPGTGDAFSSLNTIPGMPGANNMSAAAVRARSSRSSFRQVPHSGRGARSTEMPSRTQGSMLRRACVLKTEMAKKNLHTKQRPVLSAPGFPEGARCWSGAGPGSASGGTAFFASLCPWWSVRSSLRSSDHDSSGHAGHLDLSVEVLVALCRSVGRSRRRTTSCLPTKSLVGLIFSVREGRGFTFLCRRFAGLEQQESPTGQFLQPQQQSSTGVDKWGGSLGPIDSTDPRSGAALW